MAGARTNGLGGGGGDRFLLYRLIRFSTSSQDDGDNLDEPTAALSKEEQIERLADRLNGAEARLNRLEMIVAAGGLTAEEKLNRLKTELLRPPRADANRRPPSPPAEQPEQQRLMEQPEQQRRTEQSATGSVERGPPATTREPPTLTRIVWLHCDKCFP